MRTIEGLLEREVPWSIIEGATGIDQATFRTLKQRFADLRNGPTGEK